MPTKTTDGKAGAKKAADKPAAKKAAGSKPNALQEAFAAVQGTGRHRRLGSAAAWRGREQDLGLHQEEQPQNPENKREIIADDKLKPIFGKPKVTMFEMNKHLAQHLK